MTTQPSTLAQAYSSFGGKPPEVSPAELLNYELSDDERAAVRDTLETDGWKVLTRRVWATHEYRLLLDIVRAAQDHRYWQGKYAGFKFHEELALRASRKREEPGKPTPSRSLRRARGSPAASGDA